MISSKNPDSLCKFCRAGALHSLTIHAKVVNAAELPRATLAVHNCDGCGHPSARLLCELIGQYLLCTDCAETAREAIRADAANRKPHGGRPAKLVPVPPPSRGPSGVALTADAVL